MGTRADFYVGQGKTAEWLGSTAMDGYPAGIPAKIKKAKTELDYREAVSVFLVGDDYATFPKDGWPWPWEDSRTTDYAYAFFDGRTWASCFGHNWFKPTGKEPEGDDSPKLEFPDMTSKKNVAFGKRSGLIIVSCPTAPENPFGDR